MRGGVGLKGLVRRDFVIGKFLLKRRVDYKILSVFGEKCFWIVSSKPQELVLVSVQQIK